MWSRKRYFTLLETLISLALISLLLTFLLTFYRQVVALSREGEKLEGQLFKQRYCESRLMGLFPRVLSPGNDSSLFYTLNDPGGLFSPGAREGLIFMYDKGVDFSKPFSNQLLSLLYVDPEQRLCLLSWPSPSKWMIDQAPPTQFEVLLEKVERLQFKFFIAPDKEWPSPKSKAKEKQKERVKPTPEGSWIPFWSDEFTELPALIRLELEQQGKPLIFSFPLPQAERQPLYLFP